MAKLNDDLTTLITTRDNLKAALIAQQQTVNDDIRTYPEAVRNIGNDPSSGLYRLLAGVVNVDSQIFNKLASIVNVNQLFINVGGTEEEINTELYNILGMEN